MSRQGLMLRTLYTVLGREFGFGCGPANSVWAHNRSPCCGWGVTSVSRALCYSHSIALETLVGLIGRLAYGRTTVNADPIELIESRSEARVPHFCRFAAVSTSIRI